MLLCIQDNLSTYFSNLSLIFNNKTINYITDQLILGVVTPGKNVLWTNSFQHQFIQGKNGADDGERYHKIFFIRR